MSRCCREPLLEEASACCALVTAPIVLPIAGLAWCWWKAYGFFYGIAAGRRVATLEAMLPAMDNTWRDKNMLLGWSSGDTVYIALDARDTGEYAIINQVQRHYGSKRSYVFILLDPFRLDRWGVRSVMQCVHGDGSVSVYNFVPNSRGVTNLENHTIDVPGYYGPLGNRFRVSYY